MNRKKFHFFLYLLNKSNIRWPFHVNFSIFNYFDIVYV